MNKTEFVAKVAAKGDMSGAEAGRAVARRARGDPGGPQDRARMSPSPASASSPSPHRAARTGVNPQDPSKKVEIPARTVPRFTPGAVLKEAVASGNKGKK